MLNVMNHQVAGTAASSKHIAVTMKAAHVLNFGRSVQRVEVKSAFKKEYT